MAVKYTIVNNSTGERKVIMGETALDRAKQVTDLEGRRLELLSRCAVLESILAEERGERKYVRSTLSRLRNRIRIVEYRIDQLLVRDGLRPRHLELVC